MKPPHLRVGELYAGTVIRWSNIGRGVAVIRVAGTRLYAYRYCLQDREQLKPGDRVVLEVRSEARRSARQQVLSIDGRQRYFAGNVCADFPLDLLDAQPTSKRIQ